MSDASTAAASSGAGAGGVRSAAFADLAPLTAYRLWALRSGVFVVEQDCVYLDLDGRDTEPGTVHLWTEADPDGPPTAYLRVLDEGDHLRVGRVLTDPAHRGRGLAARLVRAAVAASGGRAVRLDAQAHLQGWYERLGFVVTGEEFLEDGIPHVPMELARGSSSG